MALDTTTLSIPAAETTLSKGGVGYDKLYGGDDNDTLTGGGDADEILGGRGDDILDGPQCRGRTPYLLTFWMAVLVRIRFFVDHRDEIVKIEIDDDIAFITRFNTGTGRRYLRWATH